MNLTHRKGFHFSLNCIYNQLNHIWHYVCMQLHGIQINMCLIILKMIQWIIVINLDVF